MPQTHEVPSMGPPPGRRPHPFFDMPTPLVIGHRGCAGELPENTLAAFAGGLARGAVILESDVHLTRDGVPVLIHDDDVSRCTEGAGRVAALELAELQALDAGYRFSPDGGRSFPERGRGHRVPTLAEAFQAFPGARFNLELKEAAPGLVEATLALVADAGRATHTLLTAEKDPLMATVRAAVADTGVAVALGACVGEVAAFAVAAARGASPPPGPMALQIPPTFGGEPLVTRALVRFAHAHGVQVHVWTIDDPDEMAELLDRGVDGIVTDHPGRMVALLARRRR
jgi:glycerophosphoryl diester phosphodiesterase